MIDEASTALLCLAIGLASGVASSAPIGPVDLWIAKAVLPPARPLRNVASFVLGVIVVDLGYAFVAFWGYFTWLQGGTVDRWMGLVGGLGLVALGAWELRAVRTPAPHGATGDRAAAAHPVADFLTGAFLCGAGPAFVLFWVFVAAQAHAWGVPDLRSWRALAVFAGIAAGDALWYFAFLWIAKRGAAWLSERLVRRARLAVALGFVAAGLMVFVPALLVGA